MIKKIINEIYSTESEQERFRARFLLSLQVFLAIILIIVLFYRMIELRLSYQPIILGVVISSIFSALLVILKFPKASASVFGVSAFGLIIASAVKDFVTNDYNYIVLYLFPMLLYAFIFFGITVSGIVAGISAVLFGVFVAVTEDFSRDAIIFIYIALALQFFLVIIFHLHLTNLFTEKNTLISEIHHRVKNNLQMIKSMLNLQNIYGNYKNIDEYLFKVNSRISGMMIIHEQLYREKQYSEINITDAAKSVAARVCTEYAIPRNTIELRSSSNSISLSIVDSIPLIQIQHEILMNSIMHNSPLLPEFRITVELECDGRTFSMIITDNGRSFDPGAAGKGFGLHLIETLAGQLDGKTSFNCKPGTTIFLLEFPYRIN